MGGRTVIGQCARRAASLRGIERFLLPNSCVACERPVGAADPDALVCALCRGRLVGVTGGCRRCHQPHPPIGPCRFCADWPAALCEVASAVWLGDEASAMVHHLKYEQYHALGAPMARIIAARVPRPGDRAVVLPVPLAAGRLRMRGFNQAEAIAARLAAEWRLPLLPGLLTRVRETKTQTRLNPEGRAANVRNAFRARPPRTGGGQAALTVILVDDVLTTGATLAAAAAALSEVGWTTVRAMTFARARPFAERLAAAS